MRKTIQLGSIATRGKFADEYWKAIEVEIATLDVLNVWGVKENDPNNMLNQVQAISRWTY